MYQNSTKQFTQVTDSRSDVGPDRSTPLAGSLRRQGVTKREFHPHQGIITNIGYEEKGK